LRPAALKSGRFGRPRRDSRCRTPCLSFFASGDDKFERANHRESKRARWAQIKSTLPFISLLPCSGWASAWRCSRRAPPGLQATRQGKRQPIKAAPRHDAAVFSLLSLLAPRLITPILRYTHGRSYPRLSRPRTASVKVHELSINDRLLTKDGMEPYTLPSIKEQRAQKEEQFTSRTESDFAWATAIIHFLHTDCMPLLLRDRHHTSIIHPTRRRGHAKQVHAATRSSARP
jgi:hypothetical protein